MYKILVLDLDGTLTNTQKIITKKTKEAIKKAIIKGVAVVLASGRPNPGVFPLALDLNLDKNNGYILTYNGSQIFDVTNNKIIYDNEISKEDYKKIVEFARKNNLPLLTHNDSNVLIECDINKYIELESKINNMPIVKVSNLLDTDNFTIRKCIIPGEPSLLSPYLSLAKESLNSLNIYFSDPHFLEILPENIDKAHTLEVLLNKLKIDKSEMIACGDGFNDLTMIKMAGLGVAMENAQDIVKEHANFITHDNDNDGIAHVIEKFILNK